MLTVILIAAPAIIVLVLVATAWEVRNDLDGKLAFCQEDPEVLRRYARTASILITVVGGVALVLLCAGPAVDALVRVAEDTLAWIGKALHRDSY